MNQEVLLDVSNLSPPEPMEKALEALGVLRPGQYIRMLHYREPFPLYSILQDNGYIHRLRIGSMNLFEIFIWLKSDEVAERAVQKEWGNDS